MVASIATVVDGYPTMFWIYALIVVFGAGFLRGFTGFGFALAAVPALTLFAPPEEVVPAMLIVALFAGARLLPKLFASADWPSIRLLTIGSVAGSPLGIWMLGALPSDAMRVFIGLLCLAAVLLLWRGFKLAAMPRPRVRLALGLVSGWLNGATAMGGPPVIIFFLALPSGVAVGRASLLIFFFLSSLASVLMQAATGFVTMRVLVLSALLFPVMAIGNALGDRRFDRASDGAYRRVALLFLLAIAMAAIARALIGLAD